MASSSIGLRIVLIDAYDGGALRILGTTANTGTPNTPVRRRVRLHDQPSARAIREVWSDPITGAYAFNNIRLGRYYVTAFDHTGQYGGVIETDITPEPVP
jgi:hypothetical protein